jgi:hypothetical protein
MRRIFVYFISLLIVLNFCWEGAKSQDTIQFPLKIKAGIEAAGPIFYFIEKNNFIFEGYVSFDYSEKIAPALNLGYSDYNYSQYNYDFKSNGFFIRAGADFNLLAPEKSMGKYYMGIGVRYGLSIFSSEFPSFHQENYWGNTSSYIPSETALGHFIELSPGVKTQIIKNITIGWNISLRFVLSSGTDIKPVYMPGFGDATKIFSPGLGYFISWNIPYRKKNVILKKEEPEEEVETENTGSQPIIRQ